MIFIKSLGAFVKELIISLRREGPTEDVERKPLKDKLRRKPNVF